MEISLIKAIILGLIQGLTEFLPVSSSGHLVVMQHFLGIKEPILTFDVFLHWGTLIPVFVVFWGDIFKIIRHPFERKTFLLIIGTIPAAFMGFFLDDLFSSLFASVIAVGFALLATGMLLRISDSFQGEKNEQEMSFADALIIGFFQGIAITPGISRSGSTIVGALWRGLDRKTAAGFSFLLSIPVILGAGLKELVDVYLETGGFGLQSSYFAGAFVAALSGYLAIKIFLRLLEKSKLRFFSYYCWALGLIVIAASYLQF